MKTVSRDIGKLSKLELLYFCNNSGPDELPPSIGQMLSLKKFKCNPCPRVLPVELANLGKLEVLEFGKWDKGYILFHIRPIKEIPTSIFQNLVELRTLHLMVTSTNVLPMNLWDFTKLEDLTVYIQEVELGGPTIIGEEQSLGCNDVPKGMNDVASPSSLDEDILILDTLKRLSCCPLKYLRLANWQVTSWYELLSILQSLHKLLELHVARFPLRVNFAYKQVLLCPYKAPSSQLSYSGEDSIRKYGASKPAYIEDKGLFIPQILFWASPSWCPCGALN